MTASEFIPRVITSRDGQEGIQIIRVVHDTVDRSAHFVLRHTPESAACKLCVYSDASFDAAALAKTFTVPGLASPFLSIATWYVWHQFNDARETGDPWRPGTEGSLPMDSHFVVQLLRKKVAHTARPDSIVADTVRLSTPFGVPAVIDLLLAFVVGKSFEQLRRAAMDLRDHSWELRERSEHNRIELEALGSFRAAHGLLTAYEIRTQLSAPRYSGVLEYWDKALALRAAVPVDAAGAIANASHAVEALARLLVADEVNTAGAALSALASAGRLPLDVAALARHIHGRTSGEIGARHGVPSGPTDSTLTADFYIDLMAATLRQLLIIDRA